MESQNGSLPIIAAQLIEQRTVDGAQRILREEPERSVWWSMMVLGREMGFTINPPPPASSSSCSSSFFLRFLVRSFGALLC